MDCHCQKEEEKCAEQAAVGAPWGDQGTCVQETHRIWSEDASRAACILRAVLWLPGLSAGPEAPDASEAPGSA